MLQFSQLVVADYGIQHEFDEFRSFAVSLQCDAANSNPTALQMRGKCHILPLSFGSTDMDNRTWDCTHRMSVCMCPMTVPQDAPYSIELGCVLLDVHDMCMYT